MDDRDCLKSMAHHAAGIGTCTQSGRVNPSHPSSEMHLGKSPDHTEFQSWIVNFRTEVLLKGGESHMDQGIRSSQTAG